MKCWRMALHWNKKVNVKIYCLFQNKFPTQQIQQFYSKELMMKVGVEAFKGFDNKNRLEIHRIG